MKKDKDDKKTSKQNGLEPKEKQNTQSKKRMLYFVCADLVVLACAVGAFFIFLQRSVELDNKIQALKLEEDKNNSREADAEAERQDLDANKDKEADTKDQQTSDNKKPSKETTQKKEDEAPAVATKPSQANKEPVDKPKEENSKPSTPKPLDPAQDFGFAKQKATQIEQKYGVKISYGEALSPEVREEYQDFLNADELTASLYNLEESLKLFPVTFLKGKEGSTFHFQLARENKKDHSSGLRLKSFSLQGEIGVMIFAKNFPSTQLRHLFCQWMEYVIEQKGDSADAKSYAFYNPSGFNYGDQNLNPNLIYDPATKEPAYFVNLDATKSIEQDRLYTLEAMLISMGRNGGVFSNNSTLRQKARLLSSQIEKLFNKGNQCSWLVK